MYSELMGLLIDISDFYISMIGFLPGIILIIVIQLICSVLIVYRKIKHKYLLLSVVNILGFGFCFSVLLTEAMLRAW